MKEGARMIVDLVSAVPFQWRSGAVHSVGGCVGVLRSFFFPSILDCVASNSKKSTSHSTILCKPLPLILC